MMTLFFVVVKIGTIHCLLSCCSSDLVLSPTMTAPMYFDVAGPWGGMLKQLVGVVSDGSCKVVLCGPPGSGKACAVRLAVQSAGAFLVEIDAASADGLQTARRFACGGVLSSAANNNVQRSVALIHGLECFGGDWARFFGGGKTVAIVNDLGSPSRLPIGVKLIYGKGFTYDALEQSIMQLPGAHLLTTGDKQALVSAEGNVRGDMRRTTMAARFLITARQRGWQIDGSGVDVLRHPFFDTQRLASGYGYRLESVSADLVTSALPLSIIPMLSLESAVRFAEFSAGTDAMDEELRASVLFQACRVLPREPGCRFEYHGPVWMPPPKRRRLGLADYVPGPPFVPPVDESGPPSESEPVDESVPPSSKSAEPVDEEPPSSASSESSESVGDDSGDESVGDASAFWSSVTLL